MTWVDYAATGAATGRRGTIQQADKPSLTAASARARTGHRCALAPGLNDGSTCSRCVGGWGVEVGEKLKNHMGEMKKYK